MGALVVWSACGSDSGFTLDAPDAAGVDGAGIVNGCPASPPTSGEACLVPEGTTCDFGQCGTRLTQCTSGRWVYSGNTPPKSTCPAIAPNAGVACPACWDPSLTCSYGSADCSKPDASDQSTVASCPDGGWVVDFSPCRDAGPDVQGDGGADAD